MLVQSKQRNISLSVLPHRFMPLHHPVGFGNPVVFVAEQGEAQRVLVVELFLLGHRVGADADHGHAGRRQIGQCVPHRLGLGRSAGGAGLGVEKEEALAALEVLQAGLLAVLVRRSESRGRISRLKFVHIPPRFSKERVQGFKEIGRASCRERV